MRRKVRSIDGQLQIRAKWARRIFDELRTMMHATGERNTPFAQAQVLIVDIGRDDVR